MLNLPGDNRNLAHVFSFFFKKYGQTILNWFRWSRKHQRSVYWTTNKKLYFNCWAIFFIKSITSQSRLVIDLMKKTSTNQLTGNIMNIYKRDVIMLPAYCPINKANSWWCPTHWYSWGRYFSLVHAELAWGTTEILHMHFNGASSKRMAYHHLISLDDKGNTGAVVKNNK